MSIRVVSLFINLAVPAALTVAASHWAGGGVVIWWIFYVNIQELALLAKDKLAAVQKWKRTPESTLLLLALAGASPALLLGRFAFKHKTKKNSFITAMCGVLAAQAIAAWYFWPTVKAFI
jgi:uncharacterized membrane protein YsdA (DUF1294 family)